MVDENDNRFKVRVMLDSGADLNLLKRSVADMAGLEGRHTKLFLNLGGGMQSKPCNERIVNFRLASVDGKFLSEEIEATTAKTIAHHLRDVPVDISKYPHLREVQFTEEFPRPSAEVQVMIGLPTYTALVTGRSVSGRKGEPSYLPTKLGNVLEGAIPGKI